MRTVLFAFLLCLIPLSVRGGKSDDIRRGEYLVRITSCNDCHTPWKYDPALKMPVPDMSRMLSGFQQGGPEPEGNVGQHDIALIGPSFGAFKESFGEVYAANLTPDKKTGLGNWTEDEFTRALRTGRHRGGSGRPILPPMPWLDIGAMTDADLHAIWEYLRSVPAIENEVPAPKVPDATQASLARSFDALLARMHGANAHVSPRTKAGPQVNRPR